MDGALTGATTMGQSGLGCNGNEEIVHTAQSSLTGALSPYVV